MSDAENDYGVTQAALDRYAAAFNESDILARFDARIEFPDLSTVCAIIDEPGDGLRGGMGNRRVFNGGILAAMYDLVIGCAAAIVDPSRRAATVQLSMNFERPVVGDLLCATATVDRAGKKLVFASAHIVDDADRICSHAQGVVRLGSTSWEGDSPAG